MYILRFILRQSPILAALAMFTAFLSGVTNASLIALINKALNKAEPAAIMQLGWSFAGLSLLSLVTAVGSQLLLSYLHQQAIFNLQMRLSLQILSTPLRKLEEIGSANLLAVLFDDVRVISNSIGPVLPLGTNLVIVFICLGYLCWLSWQMFLGMLLCLAMGGIIYKFFMEKAHEKIKILREELSTLYDHYRSLSEGIKELKLHPHRSKAFLSEVLQPTVASRRNIYLICVAYETLTSTWGRFLLLFVTGLILFVLPTLIRINARLLSSYILTLLYVRSVLLSVIGTSSAIAAANVSLEKIETLGLKLITQPTTGSATTRPDPTFYWPCIELVGVTHSYYRERENNHFTLGPIDLVCHPGELIFLVGDNGSGKTTLAKLLCGLYTPEAGYISLEDKPITNQDWEWYRQHFSVVFYDFHLFDRLLGLEATDVDEQAQKYLIQLQLDRKVQIKNGKLSTTSLSSGQRKRLALLTAYLEDRPFYIFDEWASNQDPMFKEIFYTQLLPELRNKGKTVFVISHDDKYFYLADRLIKMDYGKLSEVKLSDREVGTISNKG